MLIVWDEAKRRQNLAKHGLDFASFEPGFAFDTAAVAAAKPGPSGVVRYNSIGRLDERTVVAAIVAPLGTEALSLISLRRASRAERDLRART